MHNAAGRDWRSNIMGATSGSGIGTGAFAPASWMGLTANAVAPADGNTALAGEIATAGGGLVRKQCVFAHTTGANTYTETAVFTANGSDALPVTVAKMGLFTASSGGTMPFESLLTPAVATLSAVGDQLTVTETVSLV